MGYTASLEREKNWISFFYPDAIQEIVNATEVERIPLMECESAEII